MGKMPTNSLGKSSELKLHCFCLFDAYSMPKDMCSSAVHVSKDVNTVSAVAYLRFIQGYLFSQLCFVRFQGPFKSLTLCQFPYYPILHGIPIQ